MQTIWFVIAMQKRTALEELDKVCNFNYLKNRMTINNNNNGNITTTKRRQCNVMTAGGNGGGNFIENKNNKDDDNLERNLNDEQRDDRRVSKTMRISCSLAKLDLNNTTTNNNSKRQSLTNHEHSICLSRRRGSSLKKQNHLNSFSKRLVAVAPKKSTKSLLLSAMSSNKSDAKENENFIQIEIEQQNVQVESQKKQNFTSYSNTNIKRFIDYENESGESSHDFTSNDNNNNNNKRRSNDEQIQYHSNGILKLSNFSYMPLLQRSNQISEQQQQQQD